VSNFIFGYIMNRSTNCARNMINMTTIIRQWSQFSISLPEEFNDEVT